MTSVILRFSVTLILLQLLFRHKDCRALTSHMSQDVAALIDRIRRRFFDAI